MEYGECGHSKSEIKEVVEEYMGESYKTELPTCIDCGAVCWSSPDHNKFMEFKDRVRKANPHRMIVTPLLSEEAHSIIMELAKEDKKRTESVVNTIVKVYHAEIMNADKSSLVRDVVLPIRSMKQIEIKLELENFKDVEAYSSLIRYSKESYLGELLNRLLFLVEEKKLTRDEIYKEVGEK